MIEQRSLEAIVFPGAVSRTGLELRDGLSKEEWIEAGKLCALVERAERWWIGDFLNYGERAYGEKYRDGLALFELDYQSLANCKWVAHEIEFSRRRENLSWSHHEEVADLTLEEQDRWLDLAEERKWSLRELRDHVAGPKAIPEPGSVVLGEGPLMRFSQADLPTATIVALILRVSFPDAVTALDTTYGNGAFWDGSAHVEVTGSDARWDADFTSLPHADDEFDVVLFDPPHIPDAGRESVMGNRYGTYRLPELERVIRAGTQEAWRIARLGLVVKVTDHSHGEYVVETDWVREALPVGLYDVVYQVRSTSLMDPRWDQEDQLRAYNNGSTYLVFRKQPRPARR